MTIAAERHSRAAPQTVQPFIDVDVHNGIGSPEALRKYLPEQWHRQYYGDGEDRSDNGLTAGGSGPRARELAGSEGYVTSMYVLSRAFPSSFRLDSTTPTGGQPGSDFDFMIRDYCDVWPVEKAILCPPEGTSWPAKGPFAAALNAALNDWLAAEWVARDARYYGAIAIPFEDARASVREIERMAANPRFVQVEFMVRTRDPLGHAKYWPIFEAAASAGLPVSVHIGGGKGNPQVSAGWPSYAYENRVSNHQVFEAQVVSLLGSGVFEAIPDLKFVMVEGGFAWMAPLVWRMDRAWRLMGKATTHLEVPPSELLRRHIWFSTQPMDLPGPDKPAQFTEMLGHLDRIGMLDNLMFATDYPHWDFDAPDQAFPAGSLTQDQRDRIFKRNAEALFRFVP